MGWDLHWLPERCFRATPATASRSVLAHVLAASVAPNPQSMPIVRMCSEMFLTVRGCTSFCLRARGRKGSLAMIEMVTAVMGLVGAGIFIAHAFEGVLSRT